MIEFKDFATSREGWFIARLSIEEVVVDMNEWLAERPVDVINIETIFAGRHNSLFAGVRVWYRVAR